MTASSPDAVPGEGRPAVRRRITAVLLDIDDTLVDTRAAFRAAIRHVQRIWLPHLDDSRSPEVLAHWVSDPGGHFRAYTRGECDFATQRRRRVAALQEAFGGRVLDDGELTGWQQAYEGAFRAAWTVCEGAVGLLEDLAAAGLALGAVTNAEARHQREKLAALGLLERLPVLVTVDDLGRGKPDPAVFALACRRLGVDPAQTAYVGDELDIDARGARDAGLFGIWLDRHGTGLTPGDVPVARSLADVRGLIGLPG